MTWKRRAVTILRKFGYDLTRYQPNQNFVARLMRLIEWHDIGLVLDVGANRGQYAESLRMNGYKNKIISYEPLSDAFTQLERVASADPLWEVRKMALGAVSGKSRINVAGNSTSSSLFNMLTTHEVAAPGSKYVGSEAIELGTLESQWQSFKPWDGKVWLKIDTQGYESEVIKGANGILDQISCVQLEMSLVPLYDGAEDFESLLARMKALKYKLIGLEPGFSDNNSGRLLQVDGFFHRE